jgi:putative salt-induced outer membrane protein YdiY
LDDLTFNWKDIRQVRSTKVIDVLSVDGKQISGPVTVTPGQVAVGGAEPCVLPRDHVQSLTPGGPKRNYWSGKVSLGLNLQFGNTKQIDYNANISLQRRTPETRFSLDYIGNISSIDDVDNANNHRVNSEFDYWFSHRFYLILPSAEYYKDPFQNLADRLTLGGGVGYDLIDRRSLEWNVTTGPAYQEAWFESSQPGEPSEKGAAALAFGSKFKWDITPRIKYLLQYRGQYTSRAVGETTHHAVSTLSLELTKHFDLDVSFVWDRISNPKIGSNGIQPKPDDFRLILGVGADF